MRAKTWIITVLSLVLPSIAYARPPVTRLMNLYDPNTELVLEGRSLENFDSDRLESHKPAVLPMNMGNKKVLVILGPTWYVKDLGVKVKKGQKIRVIGSKVYGPRGRIYIIARKIILPKEEKFFTFRDESYIPNWRARRLGPPPPIPVKVPAAPLPAFSGEGHKRGRGRHR